MTHQPQGSFTLTAQQLQADAAYWQNKASQPRDNSLRVRTFNQMMEEAKEQPGTLNLEPGTRLLGPAPCPIAKLRGKYRYHALLFTTAADEVRKIVREVIATFDPPETVQWVVDVDPMDLM